MNCDAGQLPYMQRFWRKLIYGWTILFFGCVGMIAMLTFATFNDEVNNTGLDIFSAGFGILALIFAMLSYGVTVKEPIITAYATGFFLMLCSLFFQGSHFMHRYAVVRIISDDGYIVSDRIWLRETQYVKNAEGAKSRLPYDPQIERYIYSENTELLMGKEKSDGSNLGTMSDHWGIVVNAACEQFAFFSFNLTPIIVIFSIYSCRSVPWWKKDDSERELSSGVTAANVIFLFVMFCVGLIPLIN